MAAPTKENVRGRKGARGTVAAHYGLLASGSIGRWPISSFLEIATSPPTALAEHSPLASLWAEYAPVVLAFLLMLPIVLADIVSLTNRFVGPVLRIHRSIHALASGVPVEPLQFRKHDYWSDIAKDINALSKRLEQLQEQSAFALAHGSFEPTKNSS